MVVPSFGGPEHTTFQPYMSHLRLRSAARSTHRTRCHSEVDQGNLDALLWQVVRVGQRSGHVQDCYAEFTPKMEKAFR